MSAATALMPQDHLAQSLGDLSRHLRLTACPTPCLIEQSPGLGQQFALAAMHLSFAILIAWHALVALPAAVRNAIEHRLRRIPRTALLALSTSGLVGWAGFLTVTIFAVWR
jgi:hypothetical protein